MAPQRAPINMRLFSLSLLLLGCSEFSIEDTDTSVQTPVTVQESFLHSTEPRIDILLVIDDTASMTSEHEMLREELPTLVNTLQAAVVSWQMGVVTTDVTSPDAAILNGNPWVITSTMPNPNEHIEAMIDVGTSGAQPEAGLGAAVMALTPPLIDDINRGLRRTDAALHIVVISDGDDDSKGVLGSEPTSAFMDFLDEASALSSEPGRLTALVGPAPNGCTGSSGTALAGSRYLDVAEFSGGTIQSICALDFEALGQWIANTSQPENPRFELQAVPRQSSIRVQVNGERWDDGWVPLEDPPAIQFTSAPPPGAEILIRYEVLSS
jgi:hypothetical protein